MNGNRLTNLNGWAKAALVALIPLAGAIVGYGALRSDVKHNERDITRIEYQIDARLKRLEDKIDALIQRP